MSIDPKTPPPPAFQSNDPSPDAFQKGLEDGHKRREHPDYPQTISDHMKEEQDHRTAQIREELDKTNEAAAQYHPPVQPPNPARAPIPSSLPEPTQQQISSILQAITEIYPLLKDYAPCRELSSARTKLDEARLWIIELRSRLHHTENP